MLATIWDHYWDNRMLDTVAHYYESFLTKFIQISVTFRSVKTISILR